MMYVLDTDISIDYLKGNQEVVERILGISDIFLTPVTIAELFYGIYRSNKPEKHKAKLLNFLEGVYVLGIDIDVCEIFGKIKAKLMREGKITGDFDIMIASICIANNCHLITKNIKHYQGIEELKIESI